MAIAQRDVDRRLPDVPLRELPGSIVGPLIGVGLEIERAQLCDALFEDRYPARRTNLALLVSLMLELLTGLLAYAVGTSTGRWVVSAHGIVAFVIVVLSPWKPVVVRRGLKNPGEDGWHPFC